MNTLTAVLITYLLSTDSTSATPTSSGALNWHLPHLSTFSPYTPPKHHFKSPNAPSCRLRQVQVISRHGERYPEWYQVKTMKMLQERLHGFASNYTITPEYQQVLADYDIGFSNEFGGLLGEKGKENLRQIGRRAAARYAGLVKSEYEDDEIYLQTSDKDRCHNSSAAFLSGFFDMEFENALEKENSTSQCVSPRSNDADLNAFKACSLWFKTKVDDSSEATKTAKERLASIAKEEVAKALQLDVSLLTDYDISSLYSLCGYHTALASKEEEHDMPVECKLLGPEGLKAMAHFKDIRDYEKFGYARRKLNKNMQCSLLTNVRQHINKLIRRESDAKKLIVRFGHEETMLPLMTAFGLFYDNETTVLTSNRKWRPSKFAGFSANVMIELYECKKPSWKVRLLVNEVPTAIRGCSKDGSLLCPVGKFLDLSGAWARCDFDKMCKNTNATSGSWNHFATTNPL